MDNSRTDYEGTVAIENADKLRLKSFGEIVAERVVATNDSHGISYGFGNRSTRRSMLHGGRSAKGRQYHKVGH